MGKNGCGKVVTVTFLKMVIHGRLAVCFMLTATDMQWSDSASNVEVTTLVTV